MNYEKESLYFIYTDYNYSSLCSRIFLFKHVPVVFRKLSLNKLDYDLLNIFFFVSAIPYAISIICLWYTTKEAKINAAISKKNAKYLSIVSFMGLCEAILYTLFVVIIIIRDTYTPSLLVFTVFIAFLGMLATIVSGSFSYLIYEASLLKDDNDLVI